MYASYSYLYIYIYMYYIIYLSSLSVFWFFCALFLTLHHLCLFPPWHGCHFLPGPRRLRSLNLALLGKCHNKSCRDNGWILDFQAREFLSWLMYQDIIYCISHHIISYHIISYHIISYHIYGLIVSYVSYVILSYLTISSSMGFVSTLTAYHSIWSAVSCRAMPGSKVSVSAEETESSQPSREVSRPTPPQPVGRMLGVAQMWSWGYGWLRASVIYRERWKPPRTLAKAGPWHGT